MSAIRTAGLVVRKNTPKLVFGVKSGKGKGKMERKIIFTDD
jgi:hypothetical protein